MMHCVSKISGVFISLTILHIYCKWKVERWFPGPAKGRYEELLFDGWKVLATQDEFSSRDLLYTMLGL